MEEEISALLKDSNEKAIERIRDLYGNRIKYIIYGIVRDKSDAEECENDIYIKIWNNRERYSSDKGSVYTWVCTIARNTAVNYAKSRKDIFCEIKETDGYVKSPEEETESRDSAKRIVTAVRTLSETEQNLFLRKYYYLQSTAQIAAETGRSERAVEGRLRRLRKKLQKMLGGESND